MLFGTETVFICSPYRGYEKKNMGRASECAKFARGYGHPAIVPHFLYPQFLDDVPDCVCPDENDFEVKSLLCCGQIWIFGNRISAGMKEEIRKAKEYRIPAVLFDDYGKELRPEFLKLDDRVDDEYRALVNGLFFVSLL